ncbi:hypothetical protein C4565_02565 [Candidatus Parcubacteria bacterium]|jgi:hypothetical protein|nr:MAG: hypothetical protein C4565_02565 [Candidatus Parcubacteria bacterium]
MKLKDLTFEVYTAILDIYAETCGGTAVVATQKNQSCYNKILFDLKDGHAERCIPSKVYSRSKLCIRIEPDDSLKIYFFSNLVPAEREYRGEKEKEITENFNSRISGLISLTDFFNAGENTGAHVFNHQNYYMFGFNYNGGTPDEVIVEKPTSIDEEKILFHFLHGYKSVGEYINKEDIVAVGEEDGAFEVAGWTGRYTILNKQKFIDLIKSGALEIKKCYGFVETD